MSEIQNKRTYSEFFESGIDAIIEINLPDNDPPEIRPVMLLVKKKEGETIDQAAQNMLNRYKKANKIKKIVFIGPRIEFTCPSGKIGYGYVVAADY